jgi:hypothetical protein
MARLPWAPVLFREMRALYTREELGRRRLDLVLAGGDRLVRYFQSDAPWVDGGRFSLYPLANCVGQRWFENR